MSIIIKEKDDTVSWEAIASLLREAHRANEKLGVVMKTIHITAEQLVDKVKDGKTFVAVTPDNRLAGTASMIPRIGKKWYDKNRKISFFLYDGVHPDFQRKGIASLLYQCRANESETFFHADIIKSGIAEKNIPQRKTFLKHGYVPVELASNKNTNYYSVIYIKFINKAPWPIWIYKVGYICSYVYYKLRYKPGGIERFLFVHYIVRVVNKLKS